MVDEETMIAEKLRHWAACYNCKSFIPDDPVQFPHRYEKRQDIEISAFLTAWIAYGNRKMILRKAEELHQYMGESPYKFICKRDFSFTGFPNRKTPTNRRDTFYRFYTFSHLREICERLHGIYKNSGDMETAMMATQKEEPLQAIQALFSNLTGIPNEKSNSACKRLAMFLRWMIRTDGIVDFGLWRKAFTPAQLLIPLDTHVFQLSKALKLTSRNTADMTTAKEITNKLSKIFPGDPCLGDFALFGFDINSKNNDNN